MLCQRHRLRLHHLHKAEHLIGTFARIVILLVDHRLIGLEILAPELIDLKTALVHIKVDVELLRSQKERSSAWVDDENQRKQRYRELIAQNDRGELLAMVSALYEHKRQQQESGRKFHLCDENFLRDATRLLSAEFSLILGISQAEVADYMKQQLEK